MKLIAGLEPGIDAVKNESWEHLRYLSLFFHLSLEDASTVIVIHTRLSDGARLKGPSPSLSVRSLLIHISAIIMSAPCS